MIDIVDKATRSKMMSSIRGKNTRIETEIRKRLWAKGFRYRLHLASLPGKPDIVFPKFHAAIFINGCFWHGHDCSLFRLPKTRTEFWEKKIESNKKNDKKSLEALAHQSWKSLTIWECALRGKPDTILVQVIDAVIQWLLMSKKDAEIRGK